MKIKLIILLIFVIIYEYYLSLIEKDNCNCIKNDNLGIMKQINRIFIIYIIYLLLYVFIMKKRFTKDNILYIFLVIIGYLIILFGGIYIYQIRDCKCNKYEKINYVIFIIFLLCMIYTGDIIYISNLILLHNV